MLVTFEASSALELKAKICDFVNVFGISGQTLNIMSPKISDAQETVETVEPAETTQESAPAEAHPKAKRGRKPGQKNKEKIAQELADEDAAQEKIAQESSAPAEPAPVDAIGIKAPDVMMAPAAQAAAPTMDDARAALDAVLKAHGVPKALETIKSVGFTRLSEVPAEKLGELIAACKAVA